MQNKMEINKRIKFNCFKYLIYISLIVAIFEHLILVTRLANGHVVLTRDDQGGSLVLTGEDGKGEGGEQVVIAGNQMGGGGGGGGGGQDSRMIMQDAENREGDIVMNGKSMIIPGEDGHIVLADSRSQDDNQAQRRPPPNPFMFWAPYMSNRYFYRMSPFFGR